MKKIVAVSFLSLAIIACAKKGVPTSTPVASTPEESAWRTNCSKCHGLDGKHNPKAHTAAEWVGVVDRMQKKRGGNQFSDEQKAQILKYLSANAK
ncbi:MAG TPA: cytochrome c [Bacteroidia bacterium]|jgi:mono/diheme cytochrome c family protein|nr:cytochrome c [Bacteroidia bacterium]